MKMDNCEGDKREEIREENKRGEQGYEESDSVFDSAPENGDCGYGDAGGGAGRSGDPGEEGGNLRLGYGVLCGSHIGRQAGSDLPDRPWT